jgi:RimJ/RimL family protein N-acetyltransferase
MALATTSSSLFTVHQAPAQDLLQQWWHAMHADPAERAVAFSDLMSNDLSTFLAQDIWLALLADAQTCVAAVWLHDLEYAHKTVSAGWLGAWVAKPFRGRLGFEALRSGVSCFQRRGMPHIYAAVNVANKPSIVATESKRGLGFTRVMIFPGFLPFQGLCTDCAIFTLHPEDAELARAAAWQRAHRVTLTRVA